MERARDGNKLARAGLIVELDFPSTKSAPDAITVGWSKLAGLLFELLKERVQPSAGYGTKVSAAPQIQEASPMEDRRRSLDPALMKKMGISLETLMNLVHLAKLHSEDRVLSDCYLTLAEEKILEFVQMTKTTDDAKSGATPDEAGKASSRAPTRNHSSLERL